MAELATIARPYAEALFRATDPELAPSLVAPLQQLAQIASEPRLREFADNPKVSARQVSELILGVLPAPLPARAMQKSNGCWINVPITWGWLSPAW